MYFDRKGYRTIMTKEDVKGRQGVLHLLGTTKEITQ